MRSVAQVKHHHVFFRSTGGERPLICIQRRKRRSLSECPQRWRQSRHFIPGHFTVEYSTSMKVYSFHGNDNNYLLGICSTFWYEYYDEKEAKFFPLLDVNWNIFSMLENKRTLCFQREEGFFEITAALVPATVDGNASGVSNREGKTNYKIWKNHYEQLTYMKYLL